MGIRQRQQTGGRTGPLVDATETNPYPYTGTEVNESAPYRTAIVAPDTTIVLSPPHPHSRVVGGGIMREECRPPSWWQHWAKRGDTWQCGTCGADWLYRQSWEKQPTKRKRDLDLLERIKAAEWDDLDTCDFCDADRDEGHDIGCEWTKLMKMIGLQ